MQISVIIFNGFLLYTHSAQISNCGLNRELRNQYFIAAENNSPYNQFKFVIGYYWICSIHLLPQLSRSIDSWNDLYFAFSAMGKPYGHGFNHRYIDISMVLTYFIYLQDYRFFYEIITFNRLNCSYDSGVIHPQHTDSHISGQVHAVKAQYRI